MPLTTNTYIDGGNGTLEDPDSWSEGVVPDAAHEAIFDPDNYGGNGSLSSPLSVGALSFISGGASYDFSNALTVLGAVNGTALVSLSIFDGASFTGSFLSLSIANLTGTVALSNVEGTSELDVLAGDGTINYDVDNRDIVLTGSFVGTIHVSTGVTANLQGNDLSAELSLTRSGTGKFSNARLPQGNPYATITDANPKHVGDTISGTYDNSWGFAPNQLKVNGTAVSGPTIGGGNWSYVLQSGDVGIKSISLTESANNMTVDIADVLIQAALPKGALLTSLLIGNANA